MAKIIIKRPMENHITAGSLQQKKTEKMNKKSRK